MKFERLDPLPNSFEDPRVYLELVDADSNEWRRFMAGSGVCWQQSCSGPTVMYVAIRASDSALAAAAARNCIDLHCLRDFRDSGALGAVVLAEPAAAVTA